MQVVQLGMAGMCWCMVAETRLGAVRTLQALEQLQAADAAFLPDHPTVAFALHHCRFLHQLAAAPASGGGTAAALAIVRQQLSPLAQQHPELLQTQLKAALALLLPLPAAGGGGGGDGAAALQQQQQQGVTDAVTASGAATCWCSHSTKCMPVLPRSFVAQTRPWHPFCRQCGLPCAPAATYASLACWPCCKT